MSEANGTITFLDSSYQEICINGYTKRASFIFLCHIFFTKKHRLHVAQRELVRTFGEVSNPAVQSSPCAKRVEVES